MTLSSKVNLPHAIDFRALCGAYLVTYSADFRGKGTFVLHRLVSQPQPGSADFFSFCLVLRQADWTRQQVCLPLTASVLNTVSSVSITVSRVSNADTKCVQHCQKSVQHCQQECPALSAECPALSTECPALSASVASTINRVSSTVNRVFNTVSKSVEHNQ